MSQICFGSLTCCHPYSIEADENGSVVDVLLQLSMATADNIKSEAGFKI